MRATSAAQHVIEPIVQVVYSHAFGETDVPNEDSQIVEFDDTIFPGVGNMVGEDCSAVGLDVAP